MAVEAELARKSGGATVPWELVEDAANPETGLADPTIDYGARSRLDQVVTRLQALEDRFDDPLAVVQGLVPTEYDEISLSYTGDDLTGVTYRQDGTIVATLTLSYTGSRLTGVARS